MSRGASPFFVNFSGPGRVDEASVAGWYVHLAHGQQRGR
jgi:hypothetical protein